MNIQTSNAKRTDPISSHLAYQGALASGRIATNYKKVFEALKSNSGSTGAELARAAAMEVHETRKRLNDLARDGKARRGDMRKCKIARRLVQTWWMT